MELINKKYEGVFIQAKKYFKQLKPYLLIGLFILILSLFGIIPAVFLTVFIAGLFYKIDTKFTAIPTLVLLGLIPVFLILKVDWLAEEFATYIYYLLMITVALEIKNYFVVHKIPKNSIVYLKPKSPTNKHKLLENKNNKKSTKSGTYFTDLIKLVSRIRFTPITIFRALIGLISLVIPITIFNFNGLPYFRDLTTVPFFHNISENKITLSAIEKGGFNQLTKIGFSPEFLAESYYIIWFFIGVILSYIFLYRINQKFGQKNIASKGFGTKIFIFILSLCYIYNLFTFERFLMGQHFVLRGHFIFIPVIYYILEFFEYFLNPHPHKSVQKQKEIGFKESFIKRLTHFMDNEDESNVYFDKLSKIGLLMIILSLISSHHTVFVYYIVAISVILYVISNLIHRKKFNIQWKLLVRSLTIIFLIFLPSLLVLFNKYYNTSQYNFYSQNISSSQSTKTDIIESFSPKTIDGENVTQKILLGGASWDSKSFIETTKIKFKLNFLDGLSYYYNPLIGSLFILLFSIILIYLINRSDKHFKPILFPVLIFIPISLILSFGLTGRLASINRLFYLLPSSYTFREAGKFYSLFLAATSILIAAFVNLSSKNFKILIQTTLTLFFASSMLLFIPMTSAIQYVDLLEGSQGRIFSYVSDNCKKDKNVLFLPFNTYVDSSFGEIYISNPTRSSVDCKFLFPQSSTIESFDGDGILTLSNSSLDSQINGIIKDFIELENLDDGYRIFQAQMKSLSVNMLIVDEEKYPNLATLNTKLSQKVAPEITSDQLYLYKFDWIN